MPERHARTAANAAHRRLCSDWIEQRIICAYVELAAAQAHADHLRTVTLFRRGSLELRLIEMAQDRITGLPTFWLELHSLESGAAIDSLGCHEFNECELAAAVQFVLEAKPRMRSVH